jgi:hypothetical protein
MEQFWDRMELQFVEAALGLMATHEGKEDLDQAIQQLRGREVARKAMQVRDEPPPGKERVMNAVTGSARKKPGGNQRSAGSANSLIG